MKTHKKPVSDRRRKGRKRFGNKRVIGCQCDYRFTCRECLEASRLKALNKG